jgi:hypothetical protein
MSISRPPKIAQGKISPTGIGAGTATGAKVVSDMYSSGNDAFSRKSACAVGSDFQREELSTRWSQWRDRAGLTPASKPATARLYLHAEETVNETSQAGEGRCSRIPGDQNDREYAPHLDLPRRDDGEP